MEMIKNAVFTACITAMISAVVMTIAPESRKRELRLICTLVLISCVAAGLVGADAGLSETKLPDSRSLAFDYENMLLSQSRAGIEASVTENLTKAGFSPKLVCIEVGFDQYNYITTERAEICLEDLTEQTRSAAEAAVREIIGTEGEVYIYDPTSQTPYEGE